MSIEIQGMNTRKYFDSACEIHVKYSVNEEYKSTCSSEFVFKRVCNMGKILAPAITKIHRLGQLSDKRTVTTTPSVLHQLM